MGGSLVVAIVSLGLFAGSPDASATEPTDGDPASPVPSAAPQFQSRLGTEPDQALILTSPARSGEEITTRQLTVSGYVVGEPIAIRISLQGRREREIDTVTVNPVRSTELTGPQRSGRFLATFDLPNPRPNGTMIVEVVLLTPEGRVVDLTRRRIVVGAIVAEEVDVDLVAEAGVVRRVVGEDGLMGGIPFP